MNKKIVLSSFLVVLFCTLIFGSSALAHGKVAPSGHNAASSGNDSPRICYDVLHKVVESGVEVMKWLDKEECNNDFVPDDTRGIYGFGAYLENVPKGREVHYQVYAGGNWSEWAQDGGRIETGGKVITAIQVQLAPRKGSSLDIFAVDKMGMVYPGKDNQVIGDVSATAVGLTKLRMQLHYKP